jgi:Prophage antirepressor
MNELKIFESAEFGEIRTVEINSEVWFVGKDVAEALGYINTKDALSTHIEVEDKEIIQRSENATLEIPNRGMTVINESGLYSLVLGSKLPNAKKFKRWVTSEVLPSIRKTGTYSNLSPELQAIFAHDKKIQNIVEHMEENVNRIENLEDSMTISSSQQKALNDLHKNIALSFLGGKKSEAYKNEKLKDKVFRRIWKDFKDHFDIPTYRDTPTVRNKEALDYLKEWQPDTNLRIEIANAKRGVE